MRNIDINSPWPTPSPTTPDMLVKLNIHPDNSCSHSHLGKLPDFLYDLWSPLLESAAHGIGKWNGYLAGPNNKALANWDTSKNQEQI